MSQLDRPELGPAIEQLQDALVGEMLRLNGLGGDSLGQKDWSQARKTWSAVGELQGLHDRLARFRDGLLKNYSDFFNPSLTTRVAEMEVVVAPVEERMEPVAAITEVPVVVITSERVVTVAPATVEKGEGDEAKKSDIVRLEANDFPFAPNLANLSLHDRKLAIRDGEGQILEVVDLLGKKQIQIAQAPFLLNGQRDGFRYQTLDEVTEDLHSDQRLSMPEEEWRTRKRAAVRAGDHRAYFSVAARFAALKELEETGCLEEVAIPQHLAHFFELVRQEPLYQHLNYADLKRVFTRKMTFEELVKSTVVTTDEVIPEEAGAEKAEESKKIKVTHPDYPFVPRLAAMLIADPLTTTRDSQGNITKIRDMYEGRQEAIASAPFLLNKAGDGFLYDTLEEALDDIYGDQRLGGTIDEWRKKKPIVRQAAYESYLAMAGRLGALAELEDTGRLDEVVVPPRLTGFVGCMRQQSLYNGLSFKDLKHVFSRELTFEDLAQGEVIPVPIEEPAEENSINHEAPQGEVAKLNERETYVLLNLLYANADRLGVGMDEGDRKRMLNALNQLRGMPELTTLAVPCAEDILSKVRAFFNPKTRRQIFEAHEDSLVAQALLIHIYDVNLEVFDPMVRDYLQRIGEAEKAGAML